ncbi:hypothetical protein AB0I37_29495 [Micromonospora purpureochromogenes]|uniref:hypothetical protein n=1 Tax=Micromonospora purpureochromogenes TaxID=47872 RepID=UPI0033F7B325
MTEPHRRAIPRTLTDVLLWLLATDVAAAHQPQPDAPGRRGNLRLHRPGIPLPAGPRRPPRPPGLDRTHPARPGPGPSRRTRRLAGWFRPTPAQPTPLARAA